MTMNRRDFMKANAVIAAANVAGLALPASASNLITSSKETKLEWNKAPCRFCGTGCSVIVATRDGKVVATHGDAESEVNRGINCIKGYFLSKIMYGRDRLQMPMLRMTDGKYDKQGEFTPITWDTAFDTMAEKWKKTIKAKGPTAIGMFGSGQWTVWEGYAASKLMKAGFGSNNIDPNARHCMASAVGGFMRTFGIDEPMGCYDDMEAADVFVLWGSNMAEMHPILWSRVTDRRLSAPDVKVAVLSTFEHRSFDLADLGIVFTPQTDLAMLNYIANYIIQNDAVNWDFVNKHVNFRQGETDIGYGLRASHSLQQKAKNVKTAGDSTPIDFEAFKAFVADYDVESVSKLSGVPEDKLIALAKLYADPTKKVTSFWTMGFNQHTRGVWCNNLIYNIHLLLGKISTPGNSPFSLTGQPSACGTAREVGTFSHRLPSVRSNTMKAVKLVSITIFMTCSLAIFSISVMAETVSDVKIATLRQAPLDLEPTPPEMQKVKNNDIKKSRYYPMQPPVIPHKIDGYQIDLKVNKCMSSHARKRTTDSQAPMVSVTHYMDRDNNFLATLSPRRYFCTSVPRTTARC